MFESHGKTNQEDSKEISIPYIIIRGSVVPLKSSIKSEHKEEIKGVIREFSIIEHVRKFSRSGFWLDSTKTIHHTSNHVPFGLSQTVQVLDHHIANEVDLEVIHDKFEPAVNTLGDHVWGWVVGDRQKGVQFTETMLVNGTELTAVGELVLNNTDGTISIQAPSNGNAYYLVKETSKSLVRRLESGSKALQISLGLMASVGLFIGVYAGWKYYKKWQIYRYHSRNRDTLENIIRDREERSASRPNVDLPEGQQCVVCLEQGREVILLDCGHVCVCATCATELMRTRPICPVCRSPIDRVAQAFIS